MTLMRCSPPGRRRTELASRPALGRRARLALGFDTKRRHGCSDLLERFGDAGPVARTTEEATRGGCTMKLL
jgi:hypothetical protein